MALRCTSLVRNKLPLNMQYLRHYMNCTILYWEPSFIGRRKRHYWTYMLW